MLKVVFAWLINIKHHTGLYVLLPVVMFAASITGVRQQGQGSLQKENMLLNHKALVTQTLQHLGNRQSVRNLCVPQPVCKWLLAFTR